MNYKTTMQRYNNYWQKTYLQNKLFQSNHILPYNMNPCQAIVHINWEKFVISQEAQVSMASYTEFNGIVWLTTSFLLVSPKGFFIQKYRQTATHPNLPFTRLLKLPRRFTKSSLARQNRPAARFNIQPYRIKNIVYRGKEISPQTLQATKRIATFASVFQSINQQV